MFTSFEQSTGNVLLEVSTVRNNNIKESIVPKLDRGQFVFIILLPFKLSKGYTCTRNAMVTLHKKKDKWNLMVMSWQEICFQGSLPQMFVVCYLLFVISQRSKLALDFMVISWVSVGFKSVNCIGSRYVGLFTWLNFLTLIFKFSW